MKRILPFMMAAVFCGAAFAQPADLLISEYVEGSSFNKAIELYNGTGSAIDLEADRYYLRFFFNGNDVAGTSIALTGTVADGDVFVYAEDSADPAILAVADQLSGASSFNGDDAVVLFRDSTTVVDAIGQVGFDPGDEWGMDDTSTRDNTLRRLEDACLADADTTDAFDPAVNYTGFPNNTFDGLGSASFDCGGGPDPFTIDADPESQTVSAPGTASFTYMVCNNTINAVSGVIFFEAFLGASSVAGPTVVQSGSLPANTCSPTLGFSVGVPGAAPAATYSVEISAGPTNGVAVATDIVAVTVTAARVADTSTEWTLVDASPWPTFEAAARTSDIGAYPNPFAERTEIAFSLESASDVSLVVYDVRGREVAHLVDGAMDAGQHSVAFDGASLPSGVYIYRLVSGVQVETGRMTLVR